MDGWQAEGGCRWGASSLPGISRSTLCLIFALEYLPGNSKLENHIGARHKTINVSPERPLRVKLGKILFTTISLKLGMYAVIFLKLRVRGGSLNSLTHSASVFEILEMRSGRNHLSVAAQCSENSRLDDPCSCKHPCFEELWVEDLPNSRFSLYLK